MIIGLLLISPACAPAHTPGFFYFCGDFYRLRTLTIPTNPLTPTLTPPPFDPFGHLSVFTLKTYQRETRRHPALHHIYISIVSGTKTVSDHIYQHAAVVSDALPVCCSSSHDKHISSFQKIKLPATSSAHLSRSPAMSRRALSSRPSGEEPLSFLRGCRCCRRPSREPQKGRIPLFPVEAGNYFLPP